MFYLTEDPIEGLPNPPIAFTVGAIVVFEGTVRNVNDGQQVEALEYEAMESLAKKEGEKVVSEAFEKFPIVGAECTHRMGLLQIGEIAIRVVVAAEHRNEAFQACQYIVDEVKSRVPIWKKEHYSGGASEWINSNRA